MKVLARPADCPADRTPRRVRRSCLANAAGALVALMAMMSPVQVLGEAMAQPAKSPGSATASAAGVWSGAIKPPANLKVTVRLSEREGGLTGTIDIPDQGAEGLPLSGVSLTGDAIRFAIQGIPGNPTFNGTLRGNTISGTFTQGGASMPFDLTRGEPARIVRPQDPKPPFPYTEESVTIRNGPVALAGTLTIPAGEGPFPAVVLITGSGPQNRNQEIFDHRPFLVLADHLTRAGVMVLRCDERGVGESTGNFATANTSAFAGDAEAQVRYLKSRKDVKAIGLIGHSEGGLVAPMVAARNPAVDFIVMLAGPGVSGRETLIDQNRVIFEAQGASAEQVKAITDAAAALFDAVITRQSAASLNERARALITAQRLGAPIPEKELDKAAQVVAADLSGPWYREFLSMDPAQALRRVRVPVLAMNGSLDTQVLAEKHLAVIEAALKEAENKDVTIRSIPGLNHLFQSAQSGLVEEYGRIDETFNPEAMATITEWIRARFGPEAAGRERGIGPAGDAGAKP